MSNTPATPTLVQRMVRDLRANLEAADLALAKIQSTVMTGTQALDDDLRATLRQLRADVGHTLAEFEATSNDQRTIYLGEARRRLNAGRGVLDELRVRASLGGDQARQQSSLLLDATENAWLAARNRLGQGPQDVAESADSLRTGGEKALHDFNLALSDARAAIQRTYAG